MTRTPNVTQRLAQFWLAVLKEWHNNGECGDVDGWFLQDEAIGCGLITFEHEEPAYVIEAKVFDKMNTADRGLPKGK